MGVDYELACYIHRESEDLGTLREDEPMVSFFVNARHAKIPKWLPKSKQQLLQTVRRFQRRHRRCKCQLINDHMDLEDAFFNKVNYDKPLPTKLEVEAFVEHSRTGEVAR